MTGTVRLERDGAIAVLIIDNPPVNASSADVRRALLDAVAARKVAAEEPFRSWLKREIAPGPKVQTDEELSEYGRKAAHTVYHPAGTTKMGDVENDRLAVVDSKLNVRGLKGLRIADAGVFPDYPAAFVLRPTHDAALLR